MYIKKIILKNFQKHTDLTLKLSKGVNVVEGPTGSGKSNCVRALAWVQYNEGRTKDLRKEGTKKTEVTLVLDNDIEITRYVSNSTNGYILKVKDKEQKFDSIGRSVPKQIEDILGTPIEIDNEKILLNIDNQISLPFLVGQTNGFKAKLFNKLTGSEVIDYVLKAVNKDKLESKRKIKDLEERTEKQEIKLELIKKEKENLKEILNKLQELLSQRETYDNLLEVQKLQKREVNVRGRLEKIVQITPDKIEALSSEYEAVTIVQKINNKIKEINKYFSGVLKGITKKLEKIIKIHEELAEWTKIKEKNDKIKEVDLRTNEEKLEEFKKKYKKTLKDKGICPVCYEEIDEGKIEELEI